MWEVNAGVFKSTNGGASWTLHQRNHCDLSHSDRPNQQPERLTPQPLTVFEVYQWWRLLGHSGAPNGSGYSDPIKSLVVDPANGNVYAGSGYNGAVYRLSNL